MSTTYKGALRGKRKNELLDIANALGLRYDDETARRDEVESMIKTHLNDNRSTLQSTPTWSGLYHSIDQSDKRAARSSSISHLSPDSDTDDASGKSPKKHSQKTKSLANGLGTPLRQSSNAAVEGANSIGSAIQKSTKKSLENLSAAFRSGATDIQKEVRGEIKDAASEVNSFWVKTKRSTRQTIRKSEDQAKKLVTRSRIYLSDSTNLTALVLVLEASLLVTQILPMTTYEFGGHKSVKTFIKTGGKTATGAIPQLSLSVPNFWALLSYAFWRPVLLWTVWTVALPLLVAHIITFERKHEPSAFTFNLTRLALLSKLTKSAFTSSKGVPPIVGVVAGDIRHAGASFFGSLYSQLTSLTSYDYVVPFVSTDLQFLLTSLALAFATYEVIAHRPRASTHA